MRPRCPLPGLGRAIIEAERFGSENAVSERAAFLARVAGDDPSSLRRLGAMLHGLVGGVIGAVPIVDAKSSCGPKCRQAQKRRQ